MRPIPEKIDSKFRFVLLAATRAEQMMQGAPSKLDASDVDGKWASLAMDEISQDVVDWDYGPQPVEEELEEGDEQE